MRRLAQVALLAALPALFVRTFVVRPYKVASLSMSPALLPGDHLLIDRFSSRPRPASETAPWFPARPLERGDVLVFQLPRRPWVTAVKRCVGLPGEQVSWRGNRLRIDGHPLDGLSLPEVARRV
ncbi:MAG: signal peptidase I, partial [Holophagales bacterium]|nr:signal peptidase I [Holophagales bacterium]